jgi:AraC-like DNA-binding protein
VLDCGADFLYYLRMPFSPLSSIPQIPANPTIPDIAHFLERLAPQGQLLQLFDFLPEVQLFLKDTQSRFMQVNASSLAMHGCRNQEDILGKTDYDFHPPALAAQYVAEDVRVMKSGKILSNQAWLVMDHEGIPHWYLCTKLPLLDSRKQVMGVAGMMRPFEHAGPSPREYHRLGPVMEFVLARFPEHIALQDLAACANLSVSQLQREFRRLFDITPGEYLLKVRLLNARRRLEDSTEALGDIAIACGFYDQSHFSRAFLAQAGMPPLAYRQKFRRVLKQDQV